MPCTEVRLTAGLDEEIRKLTSTTLPVLSTGGATTRDTNLRVSASGNGFAYAVSVSEKLCPRAVIRGGVKVAPGAQACAKDTG